MGFTHLSELAKNQGLMCRRSLARVEMSFARQWHKLVYDDSNSGQLARVSWPELRIGRRRKRQQIAIHRGGQAGCNETNPGCDPYLNHAIGCARRRPGCYLRLNQGFSIAKHTSGLKRSPKETSEIVVTKYCEIGPKHRSVRKNSGQETWSQSQFFLNKAGGHHGRDYFLAHA